MTNTDAFRATVTPADLELVFARDLRVGDVTVDFTPSNRDIVIPATPAQLRRRRTTYRIVTSVRTRTDKPIIEVNENEVDWSSHDATRAMTWRIKRNIVAAR
jgi:hypothetical protein